MATDKTRSWLKPAAACAVLLALVAGGYAALNSRPSAPEVTFIALNGNKISSQSLRGKVVIVNFWATSCVTCIKEMPKMIETYNKFKAQGLEFVAVAVSYDRPDYVINYAEVHKLPFTVSYDASGGIAKAFGDVTMTPTTFVIGKNGKILKRYLAEPDFNALHALLQEQLAG